MMTASRREDWRREPVRALVRALENDEPFTAVSEGWFAALGNAITLPDGGRTVTDIANAAAGGAFDPADIEKIPAGTLGYAARWSVIRYPCYGLDWDITGLRLRSLHPDAGKWPWLVIVNGGSANVYEFFTDPLNRPGLGQYLAQVSNVLIVTIPGNFRRGGWDLPPAQRAPQYLLDRDLPADEIALRNAIYTNRMVMEGLKRLIARETSGDVLIVGHSTSGELTYLAMGEPELASRLKGRFLGWGSGAPASLRRAWDDAGASGGMTELQKARSNFSLSRLRIRGAEEYVADGYVGPLNPCRSAGMDDGAVAAKWLSLVERNRPNIKQALQDLEHRGLAELQPDCESEIRRLAALCRSPVALEPVFGDLFAANGAPTGGYRKMVWAVAKWDKRHWHRARPDLAQELATANRFRERHPGTAIRVMVFDLPLTHYGHIERPREVAAGLMAGARWLVTP